MGILLALTLTPTFKAWKVRMMGSNHLFKMPFLGTIIKGMGHQAVPFKKSDSESKSFEIDQELMAERLDILEEHAEEGGIVAFFPEGTTNKGDPHIVATFRAGGFKLPTHVDVEIWCMAFVGNNLSWPTSSAVGGKPARIGVRLFQYSTSSKASLATLSKGAMDERERTIALANAVHDSVQEHVDTLVKEGFTGHEDDDDEEDEGDELLS